METKRVLRGFIGCILVVLLVCLSLPRPTLASGPVLTVLCYNANYGEGAPFIRSMTPINKTVSEVEYGEVSQVGDLETGLTLSAECTDSRYAAGSGVAFGTNLKVEDLASLAILADFQTNGTGVFNLWFDVDKDGDYFEFDENGQMIGDGGDRWALCSSYPANGERGFIINQSTSFNIMGGGGVRTLADIAAGGTSIPTDANVALWVGVWDSTANDGPVSLTLKDIRMNRPNVLVVPPGTAANEGDIVDDWEGNRYVYGFDAVDSIQEAIGAVDVGGTVRISSGTYAEQLVVNKSLTLMGQDTDSTIIKPATMSTLVTVSGSGVNATITGLTIEGSGVANSDFLAGIFVRDGAHCNIIGNKILNINEGEDRFGVQRGIGILVGRQALNTTGTAEIRDNMLIGYQKAGIVVDNTGSETVTAIVSGNQVIGRGPTDKTAQNGIQISRGAKAQVTGNVVAGHWYTGPDWGASGILLHEAGDSLVIGNTLNANEMAIYTNTQTSFPAVLDNTFGVDDQANGRNVVVNAASWSAPNQVWVDDAYSVHEEMSIVDGHIIGYDAFATVQAALSKVAVGGTVNVASGTYTVTEPITVSKANVVIKGEGPDNTVIQTTGSENVFVMSAQGATLQDLHIQKVDKGTQNLVYISASGVKIIGNKFSGQWQQSDMGDVSRAMVIGGHLTGLEIKDNTIYGLRQPAYIDSETTGIISNNTVSGTRGWIIDEANVTFIDNKWGSGASANYLDIAILPGTNPGYYSDIVELSASNNGAVIEDQRVSPAVLTSVWVDASAEPAGDGTVLKPYTTISQALGRVVQGGIVNVKPGTYIEQNVTIPAGKDGLRLVGAGSSLTRITVDSGNALALMGNISATSPFRPVEGITVEGFTLHAENGCGFIALSGTPDGGAYTENLTLRDIVVDGGKYGIILNAVDTAVLDNVKVRNIKTADIGALELTGVYGLTVTNSEFRDNEIAVRLQSTDEGQPGAGYGPNGNNRISRSSFVGNTLAIENQDQNETASILASENYWGTGWTSPAHLVDGNVLFTPWYVSASMIPQNLSNYVAPSGGGGAPTTPTQPPVVAGAVSQPVESSTGGTVALEDESAKVEVPPGAVEEDVTVTISLVSEVEQPTTGMIMIGNRVYEITAETEDGEQVTQFQQPLTLTFSFTEEELAEAGMSPEDLVVFYWDAKAQAWIALPTRVDPVTGTVTAVTDHFTVFALMAKPGMPALSDLKGHWSEAHVLRLVSLGVVGGYEDETFRPEAGITREEFAKMVVLAAGLEPVADPELTFADADDIQGWAKGYVAAAVEAGIITGLPDNRFGPAERVTRQQAATMIGRALGVAVGAEGTPTSFADDSEIESWARAAVNLAVEKGIITGFPDNTFRPGEDVTRAQAATMLAKLTVVRLAD